MDIAARITVLEAEIVTLRERIAWLEQTFGMSMAVPIWLGLTPAEARVIGVLMVRDAATKEQILTAVSANRPDCDAPEIKIVDVFICKARKKLARFGIEIETLWGFGYRMTPEMKARAEQAIAGEFAK